MYEIVHIFWIAFESHGRFYRKSQMYVNYHIFRQLLHNSIRHLWLSNVHFGKMVFRCVVKALAPHQIRTSYLIWIGSKSLILAHLLLNKIYVRLAFRDSVVYPVHQFFFNIEPLGKINNGYIWCDDLDFEFCLYFRISQLRLVPFSVLRFACTVRVLFREVFMRNIKKGEFFP